MPTSSLDDGMDSQLRRQSRFLMAVFAGAMALVLISAIVIFTMGARVIDAQKRMAEHLVTLKELPDFVSVLIDAETGQRGFLLTGELPYLTPYQRAVEAERTHETQMRELAAKGSISQTDLRKILDLANRKLAELRETIDLRQQKGLEAAMAVVRSDRGKEIMDELRREVDALRMQAQREYDASVKLSTDATLARTVTFIIATFVNLLFLSWTYRRIGRQDWFRGNQMRFSVGLSGEQTVESVADNTLQLLCETLKAQAGAMFVRDGDAFLRAASFGIPATVEMPKRIALGDGLVGGVARQGQSVSVTDVPHNYLIAGSGLGQAVPKHLLIAPLSMDGQVTAVVELGFFQRPGKLAPELISRISETVNTALRSARYRVELQNLLEETQRQAEELQSQSEELRVSNEELSEQSRALKESQARLEQQQVELEQTNSQLEEQTQILESQRDDLRLAKVDLEQQAKMVEQASRYKSDFLANMSHELRTPLNSSLILAKLLADNKAGNLTEEQVKYARTIQSAGNDLLALINDVLDLSKIEAGHFELRPQTFALRALVDNLRGIFDPIAAQKGLPLKFIIAPETPPNIYTDAQRLEQVLKNLLSNALKFTDNGEVSFEIKRVGNGDIAFVVRDTGIGIAEAQQKAVFEPFVQADGSSNRKYGGTGLGLSISRELVRLLGGRIELSSQVGIGSAFSVIIPESYSPDRVQSASAETRSAASAPVEVSEKTRTVARPEGKARRARVADDREKLAGVHRIILIVEDDDSFAGILCDLAHESAFQCLIATTAEEGLAMAQQYLPSAIVLDIGLPDNSGMYVLERLKADARTRHIPVHIVSGRDYSETALSMGAVGYMLKPVQHEQLTEAFQKLETRLARKMRHVLVVEDDPVQLDSLQKLLASGDVQTNGVRTAAACLDELRTTTYDCMVLDLSLPDATGFSLLQTLSEQDAYSFPPVIIYTGRDLSADEEQKLRRYSKSIIIKGAKSPERLLDEVTLFLHQVVSDLPAEQQRMLEKARSRDAILEGRRVLIVEDDIRNVFAITSLLESHGISLEIARNGKEALGYLDKVHAKQAPAPDLVLMDIMMPEMDGLTATRNIRQRKEWSRLPIIALTAKAMKNDQKDCLDAGANDYLSKPLDVEKLLSLIRVWMPR